MLTESVFILLVYPSGKGLGTQSVLQISFKQVLSVLLYFFCFATSLTKFIPSELKICSSAPGSLICASYLRDILRQVTRNRI